jgi:hypothetical protein
MPNGEIITVQITLKGGLVLLQVCHNTLKKHIIIT